MERVRGLEDGLEDEGVDRGVEFDDDDTGSLYMLMERNLNIMLFDYSDCDVYYYT